MKNKELKKGGQIWIYSPWVGRNSSFPVKSVKKNGTLVTVVIEVSYLDKKHEAILYGHASSSMLSGYVRYYDFGHEEYFTCDFDLIEEWTNNKKRDEKYENIGRYLKKLVDSLL